jgi:hypothetical protein
MTWKTELKPHEATLLAQLEMERQYAVSERKRIYDRCRQRLRRKAARNA